jgi:hypothetical protein
LAGLFSPWLSKRITLTWRTVSFAKKELDPNCGFIGFTDIILFRDGKVFVTFDLKNINPCFEAQRFLLQGDNLFLKMMNYFIGSNGEMAFAVAPFSAYFIWRKEIPEETETNPEIKRYK